MAELGECRELVRDPAIRDCFFLFLLFLRRAHNLYGEMPQPRRPTVV